MKKKIGLINNQTPTVNAEASKLCQPLSKYVVSLVHQCGGSLQSHHCNSIVVQSVNVVRENLTIFLNAFLPISGCF